MAEDIFLAQTLRPDGNFSSHQITSENVFSALRKYAMPAQSMKAVMAMLNNSDGGYKGALPRNKHQRKPSITPTAGLRLYTSLHCAGIAVLEKPTGET